MGSCSSKLEVVAKDTKVATDFHNFLANLDTNNLEACKNALTMAWDIYEDLSQDDKNTLDILANYAKQNSK